MWIKHQLLHGTHTNITRHDALADQTDLSSAVSLPQSLHSSHDEPPDAVTAQQQGPCTGQPALLCAADSASDLAVGASGAGHLLTDAVLC